MKSGPSLDFLFQQLVALFKAGHVVTYLNWTQCSEQHPLVTRAPNRLLGSQVAQSEPSGLWVRNPKTAIIRKRFDTFSTILPAGRTSGLHYTDWGGGLIVNPPGNFRVAYRSGAIATSHRNAAQLPQTYLYKASIMGFHAFVPRAALC